MSIMHHDTEYNDCGVVNRQHRMYTGTYRSHSHGDYTKRRLSTICGSANAMPASNTLNPNPKGKAKAKVKARVTQLDPNNELNNEINASSSGLTGGPDQYSEDEYEDDYGEYNTQTRAQRLRIPLRQAWQSYFLTAFLAFLTILLGLGLVFLIIADSYTAPAIRMLNHFLEGSEVDKIHILDNTLILGEPEGLWVDSVERREMGDGGLRINVTVEIRLGVDTDYIMGFQDAVDDNWFRLAWMNMGRWGVSTLGTLSTVVDRLTLEEPGNTHLVAVQPTSSIPVTLCPGLRSQIQIQNHPYSSRCDLPLSRLSFSIQPSDNATDLLGLFERSWKEGSMKVVGHASDVIVIGGAPNSGRLDLNKPRWWQFSQWRRWIRLSQSGVVTNLELKALPLEFPGMPPLEPGSDLPNITDLIAIESFHVSTFSNPTNDVPVNSFSDDDNHLNPGRQQRILSAYNHDNMSEFFNSIGYSQNQNDFEDRRTIVILAHASILHPFGALASMVDLGIGVPPIPFIVSLPVYPDNDGEGGNKSLLLSHPSTSSSSSIPVVKVFTSPSFNETHIRLPLWGTILPLPVIPDPETNSSTKKPAFKVDPGFTKALSSFIRSYLSYEPSPILLKTLYYPSLEVAAVFPPPEQKMDIIRDVRLEGMWIKPGGFFGVIPTNSVKAAADKFLILGGEERREIIDESLETNVEDLGISSSLALEVLASATVHARIVLPKGFDVDLEVTRLWVDALIFDGDVPTEEEPTMDDVEDEDKVASSTSDPTLPTPFPLPNPLPPRAFARITPKTWLNATSSLTKPKPEPDDVRKNADTNEEVEEGKSIYVTAQAIDVPLQVLLGRQADLRRFVTKVLFSSEPVIAGIKGVVAVAVKIPGLTVQKDLPYQDQDQKDRTRNSAARLIFSSTITTTFQSDPRKPESDPRIEGSELILTDLPFQGSVPIGGSRLWMK
ncbi:hypothetical protein Clacol_004485 [Clathrus columnatus]|uniref:Uncharacterized protein n=1 Tax=Clathrus columnatus TaxID=1419009 RepID=A0AAV5A6K5_9AGAM|nr:hypothetical protein Clacol_004485 [Clathrus columnatus]